MDAVIEEMSRRILDWRHTISHGLHTQELRRWAEHLRDVVQPQLDELDHLKAEAAKKPAKKEASAA